MKKYQINITENNDGTVEVDRVYLLPKANRKNKRNNLKALDKRQFTRSFLNSVDKFQSK